MKVLCSTQMGNGTVLGQTMRVAAIAKELRRRGHEIKFLAGEKLIPLIEGYGFDTVEFAGMPSMSFLSPAPGTELIDSGALQKKMEEGLETVRKMEVATGRREQADVLLCGTLTGIRAAKELGIPSVFTCLQPHGQKTLEMFDKGIEKESWLKDFRQEMVDTASLILLEGIPELGHEGERVADFPWLAGANKKIRFTGPLLMDDPETMPSQEELKRRHIGDSHGKMVYVTIGGGSTLIGEQFLRMVLEAFPLLSGVKGVISTGLDIPAETISAFRPPDSVFIHTFVPGTEMIKASDVTVFHGGSSTLMTCLACGRPAVVIPSMGEQEDNAAVLTGKGAGICLKKETLTARALAEGIRGVLEGPLYRIKAEELQRLCRAYGGAEKAASMVEQVVQGGGGIAK